MCKHNIYSIIRSFLTSLSSSHGQYIQIHDVDVDVDVHVAMSASDRQSQTGGVGVVSMTSVVVGSLPEYMIKKHKCQFESTSNET